MNYISIGAFLLLMFLAYSTVNCFELTEVNVDEISGELVKPVNWTKEHFNLYKQLRLKELLHFKLYGKEPDARYFPEDWKKNEFDSSHRREKRSTPSSPAQFSTSYSIGVHKEETLLMPTVSCASKTIADTHFPGPQFTFTVEGVYLQLIVRRNKDVAVYQDEIFKSTFSIDVSKFSDVVDMVIANIPGTKKYFLAVAVNAEIDWPDRDADKDKPEVLSINDPVVPRQSQYSSIYQVTYSESTSTFSFTHLQQVKTLEAKDAEFFDGNGNLYLVFAHKGDFMVANGEDPESTLLKFDDTLAQFRVIQGYGNLAPVYLRTKLPTRDPSHVLSFSVHNARFVMFINTNEDNFGIDGEENYAFLYQQDLDTEQLTLVQRLLTFNPMGATIVEITDPLFSINSQWFAIVANANGKDSIVYKFSPKGLFTPHQSLQHSGNVVSITSSTLMDLENKKLENVVVFLLDNGQLEYFQFNGFNFEQSCISSTIRVHSPNPPKSLSSDPSGSSFIIRFADGGIQSEEIGFVDDGSSTNVPHLQELNEIQALVGQMYDDWEDIGVEDAVRSLINYPRRSDSVIKVDDIEFSKDISLNTVSVNDENLPTNVLVSSIEVGNNVLNAASFDKLDVINGKISTAEGELASLKAKIASTSVKTNEDTNMVLFNGIVFNDLEVNGKVATNELLIDIANPSSRNVVSASAGATTYDLVEYMKNSIKIDPSSSTEIFDPIEFSNVFIENEYGIFNLNDDAVSNYWQSNRGGEINGKITFEKTSDFFGPTTVGGNVGGTKFDKSNILLKTGNQVLTKAFDFTSDASINNLETSTINSFNLADINKYVIWNQDNLILNNMDLTIDNLELENLYLDVVHAVEDQAEFKTTSIINLKDLTTLSMKNNVANQVATLNYVFNDDLEADDLDVTLVNGKRFDANTYLLMSSSTDLTGTSMIFYDFDGQETFEVRPNGKITSGTFSINNKIVDNLVADEVVNVDIHGNLELLLLGNNPVLPNYQHTVTGRKSFKEVLFRGHVDTLQDDVLGYDLLSYVGTKEYSSNYEVEELTLTHVEDINKIILDNDGILKIGSTDLDLKSIYTNGVRRGTSSWPNTITNVNFGGRVEFMENVNVADLNDKEATLNSVNPEADFIPLGGGSSRETRTFSQSVDFEDLVTISSKPNLKSSASITSCRLDIAKTQCLCKDCQNAKCEYKDEECVIKENAVGVEDLISSWETDTWDNIDKNILRTSGLQTIHRKLKLNAGFRATEFSVTTNDCSLDGVDCDKIALNNIDQTFTGINTVNGDVSMGLNSDVSVSTSAQIGGNIEIDGLFPSPVDIDEVYSDSLYHSGSSAQVLTGTKTFSQDIDVDTFTTRNKQVATRGKTPFSASSAFDDSNYVLRSDRSATINNDLIAEGKITLASAQVTNSATATWDGIKVDDFFNNLLDNNRAQTIDGDLRLKSATLTGGLDKSSLPRAVNKINSVDIVDINSRALRINRGTSALRDVTFDTVVANADADGIVLGGKFHGVDLSADAVTRTRTSTLEIDVAHTFSGSITTSGEVSKVSSGNVKTVEQDQILNFLKADPSVTKVKISHSSGASADNEPTLAEVNDKNLASLESTHWNRAKNNAFNDHFLFNDATVNGVLKATHLGSSESLDSIRSRYLSLSKPQTISGSYTFSRKLVVDNDLTCPKINVVNNVDQEGFIKTYQSDGVSIDTSYKFKDWHNRVLMKNEDHSVVPILNPDSVDVNKNVLTAKKINNIDLSEDVLTYKVNDEKTFKEAVTIVGDLNVIPGSSNGDLSIPINSDLLLLNSNDVYISRVNIANSYLDALRSDDDLSIPITITRPITISSSSTFVDLTVPRINNIDLGTCAVPKILTTNTCHGSVPQTISASYTFNTKNAKKDVEVTQVNMEDNAQVNDVDWDFYLDKMVSKTLVTDLTIRGSKTFTQTELSFPNGKGIDVTFNSNVFGLSKDAPPIIKDLNFKNGVSSMPDLNGALDIIETNSKEVPNQYQHMMPVYISHSRETKSMAVFNDLELTEREWDALPFHIFTILGKKDSNDQPTTTLFKVERQTGEVQSLTGKAAEYWPDLNIWSQARTFIGDTVENELFGDLVTLKKSGKIFYALRVYMGVMKEKLFIYEFDSVDDEMIKRTEVEGSQNDLEPIYFDGRSCLIDCNQNINSQVKCIDDQGQFIPNQSQDFVDTAKCYKASAYSSSKAGEPAIAVLSTDYQANDGKVKIFTVKQDGLTEVQSISCYGCSDSDLGSYKMKENADHEEEIFVAVASLYYQTVQIGKWNQASSKFIAFQKLKMHLPPSQVKFYNADNQLYLSVLSGEHDTRITQYAYRGALGFVEQEEKVIRLMDIKYFDILSHPLLPSPLISSTGLRKSRTPPDTLTSNTLLKTINKQSNLTEIRNEVAGLESPIPDVLSQSCLNMVLAYTDKLYKQLGGADSDPSAFAHLAMRAMNRPVVDLNPEVFVSENVRDAFEATGRDLMYSNTPDSAIILYAYIGGVASFQRDLNTLVGTSVVYQDMDGVVFLRTRLNDGAMSGSSMRSLELWSSCEADGVKLAQQNFVSLVQTTEDAFNANVRDICHMAHGLDQGMIDTLKDIRGHDSVAALRVGKSDGSRYACGYLKLPEAAYLNYRKHHGEQSGGLVLLE